MKNSRIIKMLIIMIGITGGWLGMKKLYTNNQSMSGNKEFVYVNKVSDIVNYVGSRYVERYGGVVEPLATVKIKLEGERKVKDCMVKQGEHINEGQTLFFYDTDEDENKLAQLEIDIERAKGEIEMAKATIENLEKERAKANKEEQLTYTTEILMQQTTIKMSEYDIKTKTLEIEQLKERINASEVKSEVSGTVQSVKQSDNDDMGLGENAFITILQDGDYQIKCNLNEQNLNSVMEGMEVVIFSRVDKEKKWKGTVREVITDNTSQDTSDNMYIDAGDGSGSSNYCFYVEADTTEGMLLGQHVYIEEDNGQSDEKDGLWLDQAWIVIEDDLYVWRMNENNSICKQKIMVGEYDEENMKYQILSGLTDSDCIAYPVENIKEGISAILNEYTEDLQEMDLEEAFEEDLLDDEEVEEIDLDGDDVVYIDDEEIEEDEEMEEIDLDSDEEEIDNDDVIYIDDEEIEVIDE